MKPWTQKKIEELAKIKLPSDNVDFNIFDYSGDNIDDAFGMGATAGEVWLARLIKSYENMNSNPNPTKAGDK